LFRDHVNYHGTLDAYWEAKRNIMRYMDEEGVVIYNPKTEMILHWLAKSKAKRVPIDPTEEVDMSQAKLIGDHNKLNFLMVRAAAEKFGVDRFTILNSLTNFEPVRHRLQPVRTVKGINFVDDAIGSTPEATIAGIKALIHNLGPIGCVMLGGDDRDYDYSELVELLSRVGIPKLVFFPDTGKIIKSLLPEGYAPDTFDASNMDEAVKWAASNTPSGSICLLSTAAPSHILWQNFEEKGSLFQEAVLNLPS
jgi:UDP-N-acetylmuramoylalanine--D-glutamate ligase